MLLFPMFCLLLSCKLHGRFSGLALFCNNGLTSKTHSMEFLCSLAGIGRCMYVMVGGISAPDKKG